MENVIVNVTHPILMMKPIYRFWYFDSKLLNN